MFKVRFIQPLTQSDNQECSGFAWLHPPVDLEITGGSWLIKIVLQLKNLTHLTGRIKRKIFWSVIDDKRIINDQTQLLLFAG